MNQGQEKFLGFIMANVNEENQGAARALLEESFAKQDAGTFNNEYLQSFMPKMMALIKPESIETVKNIMMNYKAK